MEPAGHHGQNGPFTSPRHSMVTENSHSQFVVMSKTAHIQGKSTILPIFVCCPRHFMVTWNSDVIFPLNLHGPLLRP
ncbi:hypothetical protein H5410_049317 [Solanum commersonii]|uniref:Uncharacterized protein n=1 Tax=Solanum commersonii TaxID=4109 RepID=A0A9J5WSL7_SOLCO|nr:hypothetical protein H5410_049317 [Solanum commersonii]